MVPVRSYTTCNGIPIEKMIKPARLEEIENRVRNAGGEVVALLKTGSAFVSPAASAIQMAEAYLYDQKKMLAAAVWAGGAYGIKDIYIGLPVVLGGKGVERVIEIELTPAEKDLLGKSADSVRTLMKVVDTI